MALGSSLGFAYRKKKAYLVILLPVVHLLAHVIYGVGLMVGQTTNLKKKVVLNRQNKVEVKIIKHFRDKWKQVNF